MFDVCQDCLEKEWHCSECQHCEDCCDCSFCECCGEEEEEDSLDEDEGEGEEEGEDEEVQEEGPAPTSSPMAASASPSSVEHHDASDHKHGRSPAGSENGQGSGDEAKSASDSGAKVLPAKRRKI